MGPPFVLTVLLQVTDEHGKQTISFAKRQDWDHQVMNFVQHMAKSPKPLVYVGDLNCAHTDADLSHPEFFRKTMASRFNAPDEADRGQPAATQNERRRFGAMLEAGKLVDMYRRCHPDAGEGDAIDRDGPLYTWRGVGEDMYAYGGKGMRIDHCLVSEKFAQQVEEVRICGRGAGTTRGEGFFGSDHCPMLAKLSGTPVAEA